MAEYQLQNRIRVKEQEVLSISADVVHLKEDNISIQSLSEEANPKHKNISIRLKLLPIQHSLLNRGSLDHQQWVYCVESDELYSELSIDF